MNTDLTEVNATYKNIEDELNYIGMTKAELSRRTGIQDSSIRSWKHAEPSAKNLYKVALALNVSMEFLVTGKRLKGKRYTATDELLLQNINALNQKDRDTVIHMVNYFNDQNCYQIDNSVTKTEYKIVADKSR